MKVHRAAAARRLAPRHVAVGVALCAGLALTADRDGLEAPGAATPAADLEAARRSRLVVFELDIAPADLKRLERALPQEGWRGTMFAGFDSKKWPTVPATFTYAGRTWP